MTVDNGSPPVRALIAVGVYAAISFAAVVIVYALTPADQRPALLSRLGVVVPVVLSGVPGVFAWLTGKRNEKALNGGLEPRIKAATKAALVEHTKEQDQP